MWPKENDRLNAQIVSAITKRIRRKRSVPSKFKYLLQFDDGSPPCWSRLLHLSPALLAPPPSSNFSAAFSPQPASQFSWCCDDADHCETPAIAYVHIAPILALISSSLGTGARIKLYDPYYCAGSSASHLRDAGFPDVYHQPVDFYAAQSAQPPLIPPFDALVTNPPFSDDHPRRCVSFALSCARPFLILLPNFEACSAWLSELLASAGQSLLYMAPHKRYACRSPPSLRCGSNKSLKYVAPFPLLWFIGIPDPFLRSQVLCSWLASSARSPCAASPAWPASTEVSLVSDWRELPAASRPRGSKDAPDALFKAAFNQYCRQHQLGKVCAEFAFTRKCCCSTTSPFIHEPLLPARCLGDFLRANATMPLPETWSQLRPDVADLGIWK
jgi:hypothetical protein